MKKFLIFLFLSSTILAKDINVGDLVKLKIDGVEKDKIVEAFDNSKLELESIEKTKNGYNISLRGFNVGENTLIIGDKKVNIDIKSVLTPKDKEVYPHLSDNKDTLLYSLKFPYEIIIYTVLGVLSFIYLLKSIKYRKKLLQLNPEEKFLKRLDTLSDKNWEFQLSMAIREYIDSKYMSHFVNGIYNSVGPLEEKDIKFIEKLDRYKFSKEDFAIKEEAIDKVRSIFEKVRGDKKNV